MGIRRTGLACLLVAVYVAVPFATLASDNRAFVSPGQILEPLLLVAALPLAAVQRWAAVLARRLRDELVRRQVLIFG